MNRKNNLSRDFMVNLNIPENIYFLGRLWSDGHVGDLKFSLYASNGDMDHMDDFFNNMGVVTRHRRKNSKNSISYQISTHSYKNFFEKYNFKNKSKTFSKELFDAIPTDYHRYFWLGYFDGDGCLYIHKRSKKLNFWSTIDQDWSELEILLKSMGIEYEIIKFIRKSGKHKSSTLEIRKCQDIKKFLGFLYKTIPNDSIGLKRKYQKYLDLLSIDYKEGKIYSNFKGVSFNKNTRRWISMIYKNSTNGLEKDKYLGYSSTEDEAKNKIDQYCKNNNIDLFKLKEKKEKVYIS